MKTIKALPQNAKMIKVSGQGCLDDCKRRKKISGRMLWAPSTPCYTEKCTYKTVTDAHWSVDH